MVNFEYIVYAIVEAGIATAILNLSGRVRGNMQVTLTRISYIVLYILAVVQFLRAF